MATICPRQALPQFLMDDYIPISTLNDFIFCPYSIYLHNVYMETDEGWYCVIHLHRYVSTPQRVIDNIKVNIAEKFSKLFTGADSVMIFDAPNAKVVKYGNAIHRDVDVAYF